LCSKKQAGVVAKVVFSNAMMIATGGAREAVFAVANFRELTQILIEHWPGLEELIEQSAVAVDGQIYQDAFAEPLAPETEVFFMPRIEGG
jgi:molybdopterin converting factor small subunit